MEWKQGSPYFLASGKWKIAKTYTGTEAAYELWHDGKPIAFRLASAEQAKRIAEGRDARGANR